jgi:hypothetical protein
MTKTKKNDYKDAVINIRITGKKRNQLAKVVKELKTTRTALTGDPNR